MLNVSQNSKNFFFHIIVKITFDNNIAIFAKVLFVPEDLLDRLKKF